MPTELSAPLRVKARKPHRCDWCGKRIEVGEGHEVSVYAEGGRAYSWRGCDRCAPYIGPMMDWVGNRYGEGYNMDDLEIYMHEEHHGVWAAWKEADHGKDVRDVRTR